MASATAPRGPASPVRERVIVYPDSDGKPMADNTEQCEWIVLLFGNLRALFPNDFVAADLLWYPVEGHPEISKAPDGLVALGRPPGKRGSYKQWEEGGIPPQVVFEIWSPANSVQDMFDKVRFYERYGVEEFYAYDPDRNHFNAWHRDGASLKPVSTAGGLTSPRLNIHFDPREDGLVVLSPDGTPFTTQAEDQRKARDAAQRADEEARRADEESRRADEEARRAEEQTRRAEVLAAQLRALGIEPEAK